MDRGFSLIQSRRIALEAFPEHVLKLDYIGFDSSDKKNTLFSAHSWNETVNEGSASIKNSGRGGFFSLLYMLHSSFAFQIVYLYLNQRLWQYVVVPA